MARNDIEHREQAAFFTRLKDAERLGLGVVLGYTSKIEPWPAARWIHAIPNGGQRNVVIAQKLKREGVRAGVLDVFVPIASKFYHGMYIEFKSPARRGHANSGMTDNQADFSDYAVAAGYHVAVCYSCEEALDDLWRYLSTPD